LSAAELRFVLLAVFLLITVLLSRWVPRHPRWRPFVIALNLFITIRYLWWRGTDTLNWSSSGELAVSLTLYLAELFGFIVVLHHYLIATRSTDRRAEPPEADFSPSVDIMVTTYNEAPDILYRTLVGCQAIEYSNKRLYVLDDGHRPEIEQLCDRLRVGYIARDSNVGAKAGNLNNGLARTSGDFVVTFDADHVPVRTFLSETLGHFRDKSVAQVQTAHHFYNPDLFQGRLRIEEYIANEQDMFYHVVQPGRDVYNSSFYCGSGAVLRRAALEEIGGFPTTTVTEDLHTSMLLHSRGWRSIYVNRNLSAGLAPESFDAYLTQRRRWARGTLQVLFARGAFFLRGLSLAQRLNYLATAWYWANSIPRVIYIMSPLVFLLAGFRPLVLGDVTELLTYYIPHLAVSIVAFQLVNQGMRRIFWSDVYESCISVHLALVTLAFPFTTRRVRFAVTPKGRAAERGSTASAWTLGWPLWVLTALTLGGLVKGIVALLVTGPDDDAVLVNVVWATYNLVLLTLGLLLLRQPPQQRGSLRLQRSYACFLSWDGVRIEGRTSDLSETGVCLTLTEPEPLPRLLDVTLISKEGRRLPLRGRLIRCEAEGLDRFTAAIDFVNRTPDQHRALVELMYSSPDSWTRPQGLTMGAPEHLIRILRSVVDIFSPVQLRRRLSPRFLHDLRAVLIGSDGHSLSAETIDVSADGVGLRLRSDRPILVGAAFMMTLHWNDYERSTFRIGVVNVRKVGAGEYVLGAALVEPNSEQKGDLLKHLYGRGPTDLVSRRAS